MKKLLVLLTLGLALTGCGNEGNTSNEKAPEESTQVEESGAYAYEGQDLKVTSDGTIEGESEFATRYEDAELSEDELAFGAIVFDKYKDNYSVRFNPENYEFTLKAQGEESNLLASYISDISFEENNLTEDWETYKSAIVESSKTIEGFEEVRAPKISLVNPFNAHKILFTAENGELSYDFTNELKGNTIEEGIDAE